MKAIVCLFLLLASCIEFRLSRDGMQDRYIGWANSKPGLDPKIGPKTKVFFTNTGNIRPYLGGEFIRQQELLLGLGVIYYASEDKSFELGIRDSVYRDSDLLERHREDDIRLDPWQDANPSLYFGGFLRF